MDDRHSTPLIFAPHQDAYVRLEMGTADAEEAHLHIHLDGGWRCLAKGTLDGSTRQEWTDNLWATIAEMLPVLMDAGPPMHRVVTAAGCEPCRDKRRKAYE